MKKSLRIGLFVLLALCVLAPLSVFAGGKQEQQAPAAEKPAAEKPAAEKPTETAPVKAEPFDIGIFVPGVVAGSPLYEQMVAGAERAAKEFSNVTIKVLEAGFNQGEWEEKMMSLVATGNYELILSGNGSMPFVALPAAEAFPNQKFLIVDAIYQGSSQMYTVLYNQVEQAYMVGYLGGLITKSKMAGANADLKIGVVVGQQYPAMDEMIIPGYKKGAQAVDPKIEVDFRVLGNWYDANKAGELAKSMMDAGVDIIMTACGGANQGVIAAAQERGKYVLYFDDDNYKLAPKVIVGCAAIYQEKAVYEKVKEAVQGKLKYGEAIIVDTKGGYLDFVDKNPLYAEAVSEPVRTEMAKMLQDVRSGKLKLDVPKYW